MSWTNTLFDDAKKQVRQMVNQCMDVEEDDEIDASPQPDNSKKQIHPFQLPISYLPKEQLHPISEVVQQDLELVVSKSETSRSMYNHLFQPSHPFAEQTIQEWKGQYTSNIPYLEETQQVIQSTDENATYAVEYSTLMDIWKDTKGKRRLLGKVPLHRMGHVQKFEQIIRVFASDDHYQHDVTRHQFDSAATLSHFSIYHSQDSRHSHYRFHLYGSIDRYCKISFHRKNTHDIARFIA